MLHFRLFVAAILIAAARFQSALAFTSVSGSRYDLVSCNTKKTVAQRHRLCLSSSPEEKSAHELFTSDGWPAIKKELDSLPVFTVANEKGQPLQYSMGPDTMPFFFVDVAAALSELAKAKADSSIAEIEGMGGLDIIPYPLGQAFELMEYGRAVLIPSQQSITDAGAPEGATPIGQQIPLFACLEITQTDENGKPSLPLFFDKQEAKNAIGEALETDGDDGKMDFEIQCLSLQRAVQLLATVPESPAFNFLPPKSSLSHIKGYLEG